ncbi:MAG: sigma-70 family RNA polymerase sigma factor [Oscillospiraceae bacterium]|nr:sigma-70 family RNA polymerase sigma factor [Oscillospiraceae bacterium]MDD5964248.1 sigma-70 family RNA polymerase sigma factor [Oscillospiraceae bacterium]MDD7538127.1 sigma-70 family RNA polymerase sigma factor [Oscillospiraceae bacterium]MDY5735479.1 sigma-70 family RNA polymerase sigma factor [Oscillospiraceae bacterium]
MRNTPYSIRNNEVYGDMAAWLRANAEDNESDVRRLKRNLRLAREEELTPRQRQLMQMRFEQNMSVSEIAEALGLDKSTVSRTITRAKQRLYKCLRYCL